MCAGRHWAPQAGQGAGHAGARPGRTIAHRACRPPARPPALLAQLVRAARGRFPMAALHAQAQSGVMAWSTKLHYLGRVAGLAESAEAGDLPTSSVPLECAQMLAAALRDRHTDRAVADV